MAEQLVLHYTPKHGSWLNMTGIKLSIITRRCLERRIPEAALLASEVGAWEQERSEKRAMVRWQFKVADARTKLKRLYPS